jgi:hypothetical protein
MICGRYLLKQLVREMAQMFSITGDHSNPRQRCRVAAAPKLRPSPIAGQMAMRRAA